MSTQICPVTYDHDDELGYCAVCGWDVETEKPAPPTYQHPDDMPTETGIDRIRRAIAIDRGGYALRHPITVCDRRKAKP